MTTIAAAWGVDHPATTRARGPDPRAAVDKGESNAKYQANQPPPDQDRAAGGRISNEGGATCKLTTW